MYQKGEVEFSTPPCEKADELGYCYIKNHDHYGLIIGDEKVYNIAYLPHSCDEWVIGGKTEIQNLINDLENILKKFD